MPAPSWTMHALISGALETEAESALVVGCHFGRGLACQLFKEQLRKEACSGLPLHILPMSQTQRLAFVPSVKS